MPFKDPEARRAYEAEYRRKNGAKVREKGRKFYARNREQQVIRTQIWQDNNPEKVKARKDVRGRKHGLKAGDFERMLEEQEGCCALCGDPLDPKHTHIDHCHETGDVRGLLCRPCNVGLGMFHDSPDEMRRAILYLERAHGSRSRNAGSTASREGRLVCSESQLGG